MRFLVPSVHVAGLRFSVATSLHGTLDREAQFTATLTTREAHLMTTLPFCATTGSHRGQLIIRFAGITALRLETINERFTTT